MLRDTFGLIYAGEENYNLRELVMMRSVAALPVGGRYRAIDFQLSNMVNSGIRNVGVITQKNYKSLMDHLGSGKEWDLSRKTDGLFILPPFDTSENTGIYRGICDAIRGTMDYVKRTPQQYCILSGSYTLYNTIYNKLYDFHIQNNADISMLYNTEPETHFDGERFKDLRIYTEEDGRVMDMEFNSTISKSDKIGMDVYLMRKNLMEYLIEDATARGRYNLVEDVLMPNIKRLKIYAMEHKGYVGRLHCVASYHKLNMDMLKQDVQRDLFYTGSPVYTKIKDAAPVKYGDNAVVNNSLLANGCRIEGEVKDSVVFRDVYIGKGSKLKNCIVMQGAQVYENCVLENVILDKAAHVRDGRRLIGDRGFPVIIRKNSIV